MRKKVGYNIGLLLVIVSSASSAIINDLATKKCSESSICNSETCNNVAEQLLKNIDETIDPCNNFYQFACGGFVKSKKIPDDQSIISRFTELNTIVVDQLETILKKPIDENEANAFKLIKNFYKVCMNTDAIEERGLKTAKHVLSKLGGWPVLEGDSWKEHDFDWRKQMYKFREFGFDVNTFLGISVELNAENSSQRIVILDQADLPVNRFNVVRGFNNSIVRSYYSYLVDIAVIFGADKDVASSELKETIKFLHELGKITLPPEDRRNFTALTHIMTIEELQKSFPHMDWLEFINNIIATPGIQIYQNDTVDVGIPKFLTDLEVLLNKTSKRVQANYAINHVVHTMVPTLSKNVKDRQFQLMREITGTEAKIPRRIECLDLVSLRLKTAIGALYARTFFKESSKSSVESLVSNLHLRLLKMLEEVDWMDAETKKEAIEKASGVKAHVGYPVELMDDKIIDEFYAPLKSSDDYLQFVLNIMKFESDRKFKRIREEVKKAFWADNSATHDINAFYNLAENIVILPAGILQSVMYDIDRPQAMNYGGIGFIIGHELTHGYDDMGKQINKNGRIQNWWSDKTSVEYVKKAQCIINQYNNYTSEKLKLHLNGIVTQGENIADNGGAKVAYETYQSWLKEKGSDKCLPNVNYTHNQLFWIGLAHCWCTAERDEHLRTEMLAGTHPPSHFRVLGIVSNSKKFADDFQCPLGSPMNPVNKCTFW